MKYILNEQLQLVSLKEADVSLSEEVRKDLLKLADYLWDLPDNYSHFDMYYYVKKVDDILFGVNSIVEAAVTECGTTACAAGHAVDAGIDVKKFKNYMELTDYLTGKNDYVFDWLFSSIWQSSDNTAKGAAVRIYILLEHGIPKIMFEQSIPTAWQRMIKCYVVNPDTPVEKQKS